MEKKTVIALTVFFTVAIVLIYMFYPPADTVWLLLPLLLLALMNGVFFFVVLADKNTRLKELQKRTRSTDKVLNRKKSVEESLLYNMPTGVIMYDDDLVIRFANEYAKALFHNILTHKSIETLHQPLFQAIKEDKIKSPRVFRIYQEYYEVHHMEDEQTLYLYKATALENLRRSQQAQTSVVGVLHLDNFDDALSVLDVQERNEIQGRYLGALDDWAVDYNFHLVPVSNAKIYVYMHRENLDAIIDNDFDILDDIADVSRQTELIITLSGGFACANIPVSDLADAAEAALDMALSRGGDQIAINIQGEEYKYFGGNTNTQEKRTRISSRINAKKLDLLFEASRKVFIVPHVFPDSDALGAAIGVLKMALSQKREAYIVFDKEATDKTVQKIIRQMEYEYVTLLDYLISPETALQYQEKENLVVLVDHHSKGQLISEKLISRTENLAIIDHHRKLSDFIESASLSYIEPYASSSSELVIEMTSVYPREVDINPFEATVMLTGMTVDTNNFIYRTGARTFEAAAILRRYGADTHKVKNVLRESLKDLQIKAELVRAAEIVNKRFAVVVVPDHIEADRSMLAQIADDLLEIDYVVAAFAIGIIDQTTTAISARSLEGFNVQTIMEEFGGGGHLNNAGAQMEDEDKPSVKARLIRILNEVKQEGRPMKVILQKDIKGKGKKGDIIEVAPGFGNYLLTSKQAIEATPENMQIIEDEKQKAKEEAQQTLDEMKALKKRIDHRAVKVYVKLGKNGKLYGKITTKQIADAFKEQHGIEIDKRKIQLDEPITALGTYQIDVKLHKDVTATFELLVLEQ